MSPQSATRGPVERGFVHVPPALGTQMSAADSRWLMPSRSGMFVSFLEFQVGSCLYVTAAVQAGLTPQRGQSDRSLFEVHWNLLEP